MRVYFQRRRVRERESVSMESWPFSLLERAYIYMSGRLLYAPRVRRARAIFGPIFRQRTEFSAAR